MELYDEHAAVLLYMRLGLRKYASMAINRLRRTKEHLTYVFTDKISTINFLFRLLQYLYCALQYMQLIFSCTYKSGCYKVSTSFTNDGFMLSS